MKGIIKVIEQLRKGPHIIQNSNILMTTVMSNVIQNNNKNDYGAIK